MVALLLQSQGFSTFAVRNVASITDRIDPWPWISSSSSPYFRKYLNSWSPPSSGIEYQQTRQVTGRPATRINNNWCKAIFILNINLISHKMVIRSHKLEENTTSEENSWGLGSSLPVMHTQSRPCLWTFGPIQGRLGTWLGSSKLTWQIYSRHDYLRKAQRERWTFVIAKTTLLRYLVSY